MKKYKKIIIASIVVWLFLSLLGLVAIRNKLTYLEYTTINEEHDTYIEVSHTGDELVQEFYMPYDIIKGFSIKIGTFIRDNNSEWALRVVEPNTGKLLYEDHFNASLIADNSFYYVEFDKNVRLDKGSLYEIHIIAEDVNELTGLAFYAQETDTDKYNEKLFHNGKNIEGILCLRIYGGDIDYWWTGFTAFISICVGSAIIRLFILLKRGKNFKNDLMLQSIIVGFIVFLLLFSFSSYSSFTDELDNIRGGMIIAKGGVLYKDYVTQHTPVTYYLCSVFALLGAGSVEQFRLSYYIFTAIVWALLYIRHVGYFGKIKMTVLPILECVLISSIIFQQGFQILSDGVQGLCMVALSLEFIRYYEDRKLDWRRAIIISVCFWGSFGAAFISAYALMWVVLVVLAVEIKGWILDKATLKAVINRYWKLIISMVTPLVCAIVYFMFNHSLKIAFEQFYSFNREVYPKYAGMGDKLAQPFINAIQNFFGVIANNFNLIITAQATNANICQLLIIVLATIILMLLVIDKRRTEAFLLFMVMCCSATRDYNFHGLAAWYVAVMLIAIYYEKILDHLPKTGVPLVGIILIIMSSTYVGLVGNNLLYEQEAVSEIESKVISMTEPGEEILLDAWSCDSIYFLYKDRYPVNRAVYMLPWYMDWYERDTIDDLKIFQPNIVVYYEDQSTWGHTDYANAFVSYLKGNYTQVSNNPDGGWKYCVWVKN